MAEERTYYCGPEKCPACSKPWDGICPVCMPGFMYGYKKGFYTAVRRIIAGTKKNIGEWVDECLGDVIN